jgi:hypothetical protein
MPHIFDKLGVRFLYPDNWTLDEGEASTGEGSITVYSPEGSFWSLVLDPPSADPADMAAAALAAIKAEYENCDAEPVQEELLGQEIRGYDANFFYLDLTSTAVIRGFRTERATCLVLYQAEDRDFRQQEPVFRAMTISLLQSDEKRRQSAS